MSQTSSGTMPTDKFLKIALNLLHRQFIAGGRTEAKQLYRRLLEGDTTHITTVEMEDRSRVPYGLAMDCSEFEGKLNYGAFRASLVTLLGNISRVLEEGREVTVFNRDQRPDSLLFGITGVTMEQDKPNVLVLGADVGGRKPAVILRLMYLDPRQFQEQESAGAPS